MTGYEAKYEAIRVMGGKVHLRYASGGPSFCGSDRGMTRRPSKVTVVKGKVSRSHLCFKCFGGVSNAVLADAGIEVEGEA